MNRSLPLQEGENSSLVMKFNVASGRREGGTGEGSGREAGLVFGVTCHKRRRRNYASGAPKKNQKSSPERSRENLSGPKAPTAIQIPTATGSKFVTRKKEGGGGIQIPPLIGRFLDDPIPPHRGLLSDLGSNYRCKQIQQNAQDQGRTKLLTFPVASRL